MPLTTYTAGEVLTAASLNANLSFAASSPAGGLICVKAETAFSAVSSTTADGVFTSAYTNYKVIVRFTTSAADLGMQFGVASSYTASNYNFQQLRGQDSTASASRSASQTSAIIADSSSGSFFCLCTIDISGVQLAEPTNFVAITTHYWVCCGQRMCSKCDDNQILTNKRTIKSSAA